MKKFSKSICFILVIVITITSLAMHTGALSVNDFDDIEDHWAYEYIEEAIHLGLIQGTSKDKFSPNDVLSRAMLVTIVGRYYDSIFGGIEEKNDKFVDTEKNTWYSKYVAWASEISIISGYGGDRFGPNDPLSREQCARVLSNLTSYLSFDTVNYDGKLLSDFKDSSSVSSWAVGSMKWAVGEGILSGTPSKNLEPHSATTRAEFATLFNRYIKKYDVSNDSYDFVRYRSQHQVNSSWSVTEDTKYKYYNLTVINHNSKDVNTVLASNRGEELSIREEITHAKIKAGEVYSYSSKIIEDPVRRGNIAATFITPVDGSPVDVEIRWLASTRPFK